MKELAPPQPFSMWTRDQWRAFSLMTPEQQRAYMVDNLHEYAVRLARAQGA